MSERPADWLRAKGAQNDLVEWASRFEDLDAMWTECPRGDWLLAMAVARGARRETLERAMLAAATLALDHVEDADRSRLAGLLAAPRDERIAAAAGLERQAASAAGPGLATALEAISIALAGRTEDAASVAALVAHAAVLDAGDCAMMPALSYAYRRTAELVRDVIPSLLGA